MLLLNINYIIQTTIKTYNGIQQTVYVMLGPNPKLTSLSYLHAKKESKHKFSS
jgi:hypothetical protein